MMAANDLAVQQAVELAGIEFIDENGGGAGVTGGRVWHATGEEASTRLVM